ncbi:hypothetical protein, partial [Faecalibacterium sp. An192]|uniref:hypothetical protein n=1 Tax=Faecalibacterium sp. An192 TaxID=1965581 RepID=UPI0019CF4E02
CSSMGFLFARTSMVYFSFLFNSSWFRVLCGLSANVDDDVHAVRLLLDGLLVCENFHDLFLLSF